ncbi:MAG: stage II sporulation protein R [Oscillospiraceae bacterium]|nr:stage II sporulation protein R [Oscillospiraceae bacterium]
MLMGTWLAAEQRALAGELVRLHVVGASDSEEDQAVKLQVRDAVLAQAQPWLEGVTTQEEARRILEEHLEELAQAGAQVSNGAAVTARIAEDEWFPTKEYTDFALPAGRYTALKIVVGEGEGHNWWCVVFPPLCMNAVSEVTREAGNFTQDQVKLITGESEGYVVRFRMLELWNQLTRAFR